MYVALSDPGVIWGQKYHLCLFVWKLKFGDWNHQRCFPWWQKMQKSAEKWSEKTFLHFLALWPRMIWSIFTPYVCYLEGISTMWATPYVVKYLNKRNTRMFRAILGAMQIVNLSNVVEMGSSGPYWGFFTPSMGVQGCMRATYKVPEAAKTLN